MCLNVSHHKNILKRYCQKVYMLRSQAHFSLGYKNLYCSRINDRHL